MPQFTPNEERIIHAMYRLSRFATTNEIARKANNMSWNTAKETLQDLARRNIVTGKKEGKSISWRLNF